MRGKRGFEFSFAWLFAIIVGAMIIFLAIYAAVRLIDSGRFTEQTKAAKEMSIIFNPLETGLASGKFSSLKLNAPTRVYNECSEEGNFGNEKFSLAQKSGFTTKWPLPGAPITVYNKYVFSEKIVEGSELYFFSKPFNMPFKVSELIYMTSKNYCFMDAPEFIQDEVNNLGLKNVKLENCTDKDVLVCFGTGNSCNISVIGGCEGMCDSEAGEYEFGEVRKEGESVYYIGSLIYGAIFSDTELYSCNFKRLMLRIQQISALYRDESNLISTRGCDSSVESNLAQLAETARAASSDSMQSILSLKDAADMLDIQNSAKEGCNIY